MCLLKPKVHYSLRVTLINKVHVLVHRGVRSAALLSYCLVFPTWKVRNLQRNVGESINGRDTLCLISEPSKRKPRCLLTRFRESGWVAARTVSSTGKAGGGCSAESRRRGGQPEPVGERVPRREGGRGGSGSLDHGVLRKGFYCMTL